MSTWQDVGYANEVTLLELPRNEWVIVCVLKTHFSNRGLIVVNGQFTLSAHRLRCIFPACSYLHERSS